MRAEKASSNCSNEQTKFCEMCILAMPRSPKWVLYYFCYLPGVIHPLFHQNGYFIISAIYQAWAILWFIKMGVQIYLLLVIRCELSPWIFCFVIINIYFKLQFIHSSQIYNYTSQILFWDLSRSSHHISIKNQRKSKYTLRHVFSFHVRKWYLQNVRSTCI